MVNWKELGEIPDSEDEEGFESQQSGAPIIEKSHPVAGRDEIERDVWDFPDSEDDGNSPAHQPPPVRASTLGPALETNREPAFESTCSSPLSSVPSENSLRSATEDVGHLSDGNTTPAQRPHLPAIATPCPVQKLPDIVPTVKRTNKTQAKALTTTTTTTGDVSACENPRGGSDSTLEALRVAVRYERSLRPRKPIQEHPYLLESAQFSSTWKRHGLKPLKVAVESDRTNTNGLARLSEDGGFEENSQESVQLPASFLSDEDNDLSAVPDGLDVSYSTPLRHSPSCARMVNSSPPGSQAETEGTSIFDQDLPALEDLLTKPQRAYRDSNHKRQGVSSDSCPRKRRRRTIVDSDPVELDSSHVVSTGLSANSPSLYIPIPLMSPTVEKAAPPDLDGKPTSFGDKGFQETLEIHKLSDDDELAGQSPPGEEPFELSDSATISESDGEAVIAMKSRIRGVLPASWLRLDQQTGRAKAETTVRNNSHRPRRASLAAEGRRGVARLRRAAPSSTAIPDPFAYSDDDDDDESDSLPLATHADLVDTPIESAIRAVDSPASLKATPVVTIDDDEDSGSAMEDNRVECNTSFREYKKRQTKLHTTNDKEKKKKNTTSASIRDFRTPTRQPTRPWQTKITGHLTESRPNDGGATPAKTRKRMASKGKHEAGPRPRPRPRKTMPKQARRQPLKLGILDTIQADAPRFLKIAARTAKSRINQGRSCPQVKRIQLASRQDQIDAVSVLNQWRSGLLKQSSSVTKVSESLRKEGKSRVAAGRSTGTQACRVAPRQPPKTVAPRKFVKHVSAGGSIQYFSSHGPSRTSPVKVKHSRQRDNLQEASALRALTRPAQLETVEPYHRMTKLGFHRKKKFLDSLYQHDASTPTLNGFETRSFSDADAVSLSAATVPSPVECSSHLEGSTHDEVKAAGPRRRKRNLPRRIDVSAPQYSHANDPVLPVLPKDSVETTTLATHPTAGKLHGLGPYGTQYTHHFEIFPLQPGVFFHESTLIGNGSLQSCATLRLPTDWTAPRPHMSMTLNTHILRWGSWSAQVSSEFGVVLDFVADQLEARLVQPDSIEDCESAPIQAMDFLLSYAKDSVSFVEESQKMLFVSRIRECFSGLNDRFVSATTRTTSRTDSRNMGVILQVYDRLLLTALVILQICRQDPNLVAESFACEELLRAIADAYMSALTKLGFEALESLYVRLGSKSFRDVGIRDDTPEVHSWVVNMRVLELARIPRASFWELLQQHIGLKRDSPTSSDAREHERVWHNMFMLLPLVEFSDSGVLLAGKRHEATSDGWAIPQGLMKQVFQLYNANSHQAASFNSYCRALVGRCHFLVQEWGWRRCVSVIGLIFDFFGGHQLAHLRNEEVYKSPSFLENLAGQPSLQIEPEDRCFHVFLKLVGLAIRKMRDAACLKDVRNLVARTVPNHNRQHNKDEKVHERDLAALRNHHDLLCVLFWAAPAEYRPSPALIQQLVVPATSHKEACLINLRAWNQVARYVIASGEAWTSWKPFHVWRNTFFDQVLQQYNSVASDVALQLAALGKEASRSVSEEVVQATIAINKAAFMDILYVSASASLDVVRHAPDLASATFAMNRAQLRTIFTQFSISPPDLEWGILRTSLATLESMLTKIDEFKATEESQQSESQVLNSAVADDALLALDQELSQSFFSMARCVLSTRRAANRASAASATTDRDEDECVEHIVTVAARLGMRFVNGGLIRSSDLFNKSKYQMFQALPPQLDLHQRTHLPLFISTLLQYRVDNFDDAGFNLAQVWVCCLVKPRMSLRYELQLGQQLHQRLGMTLVPETVAGLCALPDYNMTRDLFEYSVSSMRQSLRDAGPTLHRTLSAEYSSALKAVMEQMKGDLKTTNQMLTATEHNEFVLFVQKIVSLIKTHASDMCAVDGYFYQISKEYSPPAQDPQLQVASIVSYGLKLQDGDTRSSRPLFYLLFNNAKFSMVNNTISEQVVMLLKSMANANIKNFILCKMLPAVINVAFAEPDAFPLLDIYLEAVQRCYAGKAASQELTHEDTTALCILWRTMCEGVRSMGIRTGRLTPRQLYVMRQVVALQNLFWPSIYVVSLSNPTSESWTSLWDMLARLWDVFRVAEGHMNKMRANEWGTIEEEIMTSRSLFAGRGGAKEKDTADRSGPAPDADLRTFSENMIQDVRKCWKVTAQAVWINIQGSPNKRASDGLRLAQWDMKDLARDLYDGTREWCWWWRRANGTSVVSPRYGVSGVF
ncbi:hypothetical protein E4U43_002448 [Claviceps pusilla]|uniref:Uncharacterized protein n=1 Tax=Claviceps pusilla TaxID=123648 RepID=A0A9P7NFX1_9HYPO|nr:hypothetical protein E4U43_002448 [Claviceps pusilla]